MTRSMAHPYTDTDTNSEEINMYNGDVREQIIINRSTISKNKKILLYTKVNFKLINTFTHTKIFFKKLKTRACVGIRTPTV